MELQQLVTKATSGVRGLTAFERVVALLCLVVPVILIGFDATWPPRGSISDYYAMDQNQIFYFTLTFVVVMFLVNGTVREGHWYNVALGVLLAGVILFNKDDFTPIHNFFAIGFFVFAASVIALFSTGTPVPERWKSLTSASAGRTFRGAYLLVGLLVFVAFQFVDAVSVFWAEWAALAIVTVHFLLSNSNLQYEARSRKGPRSGEGVSNADAGGAS